MTELKMATWWTPLGYQRALEPAAYRALVDDDSGPVLESWDSKLASIGYFKLAGTKAEDDVSIDFMLIHCRNNGNETDKPHMLVEMWDGSDSLGQIWVADEHTDAYWFDKYPDLVAKQRQAESALQQTKLVKAQIAFIRHGHGSRTVDSAGYRTLDDVENERQAEAYLMRQNLRAST